MIHEDWKAKLNAINYSRDVSCDSRKSIVKVNFHPLNQTVLIEDSDSFFLSFFEA